ncbi:MAG: PLDc N-terminal domain-containing protein [Ectothiorhodospiraceae bacterium]
MMMPFGSILSLIFLAILVWAIVRTVSSRAGTGTKLIWVLILILLPLIGLIAWLLLGPT